MEMFDQLLSNAPASDFLAGGLALGAFGVVAAFQRVARIALYQVAVRRIWVSLTLDNRSAAYRQFCIWMEHNNILVHFRHVRRTDSRWVSGTNGYPRSKYR
ncbi:hypothetical protein [Ruegeria arenilitoris]|uniref:hypothetical protein n=1 Tax=Ruegeria arenilitoris TaxID=1173585 RepID=UPI001480CA71|nr:hypothetical protein [Ruegeria arenilitoris]